MSWWLNHLIDLERNGTEQELREFEQELYDAYDEMHGIIKIGPLSSNAWPEFPPKKTEVIKQPMNEP